MRRSRGSRSFHLATMLAAVWMLLAAPGCMAPSVSGGVPAASVGATLSTLHGSASRVVDGLPGAPLDEALDQVGRDVPLPETSTAGPLAKAMVDPTAGDLDDNPGLYLIYKSGVELTVSRRVHDMGDLEVGFAPFTDGRRTHFERQVVEGSLVLVGRAGLQKHSHGENYVPPMLMWNQADLGYTLVGPTQDFAIDDLMAIMKSVR